MIEMFATYRGKLQASLWISTLLFLSAAYCKDVRLPPSIAKHPGSTPLRVYRPGQKVTLECIADGQPAPEYEWLLNDQLMTGSQGYLWVRPGVIEFDMASTNEGKYQCRASNQYGVALSSTTEVSAGFFSDHAGTDELKLLLNAGEALSIPCFKFKSHPKPVFSWTITEYSNSNEQPSGSDGVAVKPSKRIQIDESGTLHFSYLKKEDSTNNLVYKCKVFNTFVDTTKGGSYTSLKVQGEDVTTDIIPRILFNSGPNIVVLEGKELRLRCFFKTKPECDIKWEKAGESHLMQSRVTITNSGSEYILSNVSAEDAGVYSCTCENPLGSAKGEMIVTVEAIPIITKLEDRPRNRNITEGDTVTFHCIPHASPRASITWWKNKDVLKYENLPNRMTMTPDKTSLTIRDVNRNSDLMVIHCIANNNHGEAIYAGYLNVLKRTVITEFPVNVTVDIEGDDLFVTFKCIASTDDSTPLSLKWLFDPVGGNNLFENVHGITDKVVLENNNQTLTIRVQNSTEWSQHEGRYKCQVDNGYSNASHVVHLKINRPTIAPPPESPVISDASSLWWILLIVILLLLLLIILVCCCCFCWRNKGGEYKVDKKERKNGNDPEKELKSSGFFDYQRPSSEPFKGSRASLGSSIKMDSDDEGSLNEYGDIDAGKFGEDGSFIGDYNTENRRNHNYQRV